MRDLQVKLINNPSIVRWFQLLNIFEKKQIVTTVYLAKKIGASQRTIISDLSSLKRHFGESASFHAGNNGYEFQEIDMYQYSKKKQELLGNEPVYEIFGNIFYGDLDTITDTAHYLNYSVGSLRRILASIQPVLRNYSLTLSVNPINIHGDESCIRKFFLDFYYEGFHTPYTMHPPKRFQEILLGFLDESEKDIELDTGSSFACFYYTVYIVVERNRQGHTIDLCPKLAKQIYKEKDFDRLEKCLITLGETYDFQLTKQEVAWIHYTLLTKRPLNDSRSEALFYERFCLWPEVNFLAKKFIEHHGYNDWNKKALNTFFKSIFLSIKINDAICPILNRTMTDTITTIKESYPKEFKQNIAFLKKNINNEFYSSRLFNDIAAILTAYCHILAIYHTPRKKIVFLLEGDYLNIQNIKAQAIKYLGNSHDLQFLPIWSVDNSILNDYQSDLIITNYAPHVTDYLLSKKHILTNPTIHAHDWQRIFKQLALNWHQFFD